MMKLESMEEKACWVIGCVNMAMSLIFSAIAAHSKKLDDAGKKSMQWGTNVH